MKMKQFSEKSEHKILTPEITQNKEYNMIHIAYKENSLQDIALRDSGWVSSHALTLITRAVTRYVYQYWRSMDWICWFCLSVFYLKYLLNFTVRVQSTSFPTKNYIYIYINSQT